MMKIKTQFVPMEIRHIGNGSLAAEIAEEFAKMQKKVIAHADKYGDAAKGATGTLTVSVKTTIKEPEQGLFLVSGSVDLCLPKRPPHLRFTNPGNLSGEKCLVAQETVDEETGEVMTPSVM